MGLQGQLNDASSDSIPLLVLAQIANCFRHLRNLLFDMFHSTGLRRFHDRTTATPVDGVGVVGSGLVSLVVLAEQLNLNKVLSYGYNCGGGVSDCVVCLCRLRDGEQVRELDCCHVFHKDCFDGWLHHFNFNCPLCRSPLEVDRRVEFTRKRVGGDLLDWFSLR
ncbi:RING-H2 finger A2A [Hibiscus trionum]|uniref:RING-H2 finger A2A n=1 Tax=Hibiscus trionum TaxID=183268 RepID=A0A9W7MGH1_HIBTR|nr:RING-H2 finger A2A [Hibiscus trionum]